MTVDPPRLPKLLVWTLRRTGGTTLQKVFGLPYGPSRVLAEPFNWDRKFGAISKQLANGGAAADFYTALLPELSEPLVIKHCLELASARLNATLLSMSLVHEFKHIILYRRNELSRIQSLIIAESTGFWGQARVSEYAKRLERNEIRAKPFDFDRVRAVVDYGISQIQAIRNVLHSLGVNFVEISTEDLYAEDARSAVYVLAEFADVGLDTAAVRKQLIVDRNHRGQQNSSQLLNWVPNAADFHSFAMERPELSDVTAVIHGMGAPESTIGSDAEFGVENRPAGPEERPRAPDSPPSCTQDFGEPVAPVSSMRSLHYWAVREPLRPQQRAPEHTGYLKKCDVRTDVHLPGRIAREYGPDKSGQVLYEFNSQGYRGEEYDPSANFRICIIGESCAFGIGVSLGDTFGYRLKQHVATSLGLDIAQVNLINLSAGGASADYCARTLYRQMSDCEVDLVICHLPPPDRVEYTDGKTFHSYGMGVDPKNLGGAPAHVLGFFEYYNRQVGRIDLIKDALLMQAFLRDRKIDYVLVTQDLFGMKNLDYLKDYFDRLDINAVFEHRYFTSKADLAADGKHAGPRCHAALAVGLLSFFGRMQSERGNKECGRRIEDHASFLRATDEDWAYCNAFITALNAKRERRKA